MIPIRSATFAARLGTTVENAAQAFGSAMETLGTVISGAAAMFGSWVMEQFLRRPAH